jgi:3-oxocholest-4-en-26-oyl-CoA dehydrogenase alpha subunit
MNFAEIDLDDTTQEFWSRVRAFFDEHVTDDVHAEERRTGNGFAEALHLALGARGWITPRWPVAEGGAGLDATQAHILELEYHRSGAPRMLTGTTILPTIGIKMFGSDRVKTEVLPEVAAGNVRICLGFTEPECGSDLAGVRTRAVQDGDHWIINGQKMFTSGAQSCQYCFCLTRTDPQAPKHRGLTVFLVPLHLAGIEIHPIMTMGGERTNVVHFDDVRVPDRYRIGAANDGWKVMSAPLAQEHGIGEDNDFPRGPGVACARMTRRLHDAAVAWLREQRDRNGKPRLDDPVIRERLARIALDIEISEITPGPMGRVAGSDALVHAASELLEILGPAALIQHGDDHAAVEGLAEYVFRFAPGTAIYGGTTDIHRNMVAERILGLPRSTPNPAR